MEVAATTSAPVTTPNVQTANDRGNPVGEEVSQNGTEIQGEKEGIHAEKAEAKPKVKKKFVVDKKEVELELDDETTDRYIQKALAADKRIEAAAKERRELEGMASQIQQQRAQLQQLFQTLQGGDEETAQQMLIQAMGPERFAAISKKYLLTQYEYDQLSPEARRAYDAERRAVAAEEQLQQRQRTDEEMKINELKSQNSKEFEGMIIKAIETNMIPKSERAIGHFVDYMKKFVERDIPIDEQAMTRIASAVKEDNIITIRGLVSGFTEEAKKALASKDQQKLVKIGEELTSLFGDEIISLIRRSDLAKLRSSQPELPKQIFETPRVDAKSSQQTKNMSPDEWRDEVRNRALQIDAEARRAR